MATVKRVCRQCGKEYDACSTPNLQKVARWFDICCSRDCYREYIIATEAARAASDGDNKDN